jgi:hypothetical protein
VGSLPWRPPGLTIDRISIDARNFGFRFAVFHVVNATRWADFVFGESELGDERRTARLVEMARRALLSPAGRVTQVFRNAGARQAAYDFLEHDTIAAEAVGEALFRSTARASSKHERVLVAIDGTSINVVDEDGVKGFGSIGALSKGAHGLKTMNALALTPNGTPIGVADQIWWSRHTQVESQRRYRNKDNRESRYWRDGISRIASRYRELCPGTKLHFLADREADASYTIKLLLQSNLEFTIRSNGSRRIAVGHERRDLRRVLIRQRSLGVLEVPLPETAGRPARLARLDVRAARVPMVFRDHHQHERRVIPITVVWARERGHAKQKVEWLLLTNVPARTRAEAFAAVTRYTMRWRIEDFHRTWKAGACCVEDTQLRSASAVIKWATILAAVASRIERLRRRCREEPNASASSELSPDELDALALLRSEEGQVHQPSAHLTILEATMWIAELGGYVVTTRGGPPGATTVGRGLERVAIAAELIARLRAGGRLR